MRVFILFLIFSLIALPVLATGRYLTDDEMEKAIFVLRWAIVRLAEEVQAVLIEVQQTDIGPSLRGRIDEAILFIQEILEALGARARLG